MMYYSENPCVNFTNHQSNALLSEVHSCTVGTKIYNLVRKLNHSGNNRYASAVLASNVKFKKEQTFCQNYIYEIIAFTPSLFFL
jgi:hypothetical protein